MFPRDRRSLALSIAQIFLSKFQNVDYRMVIVEQVSISPAFCAKAFFAASLSFCCIFCWQNIDTKADHKMLVKLAIGVNFNNILQAAFFIQKCFALLTVWLCNYLLTEYWHISCSLNVGKIGYRCQFQQHLQAAFFIQKCFALLTVWLCNYLLTEYWHKSCSLNVGKIGFRCQFQQHFTSSFFIQKCFAQLFYSYSFAL